MNSILIKKGDGKRKHPGQVGVVMGGRSRWLFGENHDIHNLNSYLPGMEEMVLHSLRTAGEE